MDDERLMPEGTEEYVRPSMEVIEMEEDVIVTSCTPDGCSDGYCWDIIHT